jgi:hypothetical protein
MEKKLLLAGLALSMGVAAWTGPAGAQLFTSTGPVIAIRDGELLVGEATGDLGGWGTIAQRSRRAELPAYAAGRFPRLR